jgi:hypothetical protein
MPNPYQARVDVRRFLNFPGFHDGAYVVAYVEDTSQRPIVRRNVFDGGPQKAYVNPRPRVILEIAHCANRINLEFDVSSELDVENSLYKLDTLVDTLIEMRRGLVEEARLYREREPDVKQRNGRERGSAGRAGARRDWRNAKGG